MKSHLRDHLLRCGLDGDEPNRTKGVIDNLLHLENKRKGNLCGYSRSIQQLKDYYGNQWVVAADALRKAGVPVYAEAGIDSNLVRELDFDAYITGQGIQFTRSEQHLHVGVASTGVADRVAISNDCTSRGVNTSPLRNERIAGKNESRDASTSPVRDGPVVSTSSIAPGSLPDDPEPVASTSSLAPGSLPDDPEPVASTSSLAPGSLPDDPEPVASTSSLAPGSLPDDPEPVASTSSLAPGSLPDDPEPVASTSYLAPEKSRARNTVVASDESRVPDSPYPGGSVVAEDGDTSLPSVPFTLPDDTDAFRDEFIKARDELDWNSVIKQSRWLERKYGLGIRTNLADQTSYFTLFEDFTNAVDAKLQIRLIDVVRNSPGMPEIEHSERELLHVLVAVYNLALPYISDTSNLPRSEATPPRAVKRRARIIVSSDEESDSSPIKETPRKKIRLRTSSRKNLTRIDYSETALSPPHKRVADSSEGKSPKSPKSAPHKKTSLTPDIGGVPINRRVGLEAEAALQETPSIELPPNKKMELVKAKLANVSIAVGNDVRKRIVLEHPLLAEWDIFLFGLELSPAHIKNQIGNFIRLMNYYTDGNPYDFTPDLMSDVPKFHRFVQNLEEANCASETIKKYMDSVRNFVKFIIHIDRYPHLDCSLFGVRVHAEMVAKRTNKRIKQERMARLSRADYEKSKDQLVRLVTDFNERLRPRVDAYFKGIEGKERSEIEVNAQSLKMVNIYFFYYFLRLGYMPCVFEYFPIDRYRDALTKGPKEIELVGMSYYLTTEKHKTAVAHGMAAFHLEEEVFERLITYVEKLRPQPANKDAAEHVWLNSRGTKLSHLGEYLREVMATVKGGQYCPNEIRHALATVGYEKYSGKDREEFVAFMQHTVQTADKHKLMRGQVRARMLTLTRPETERYEAQLARRAAARAAESKSLRVNMSSGRYPIFADGIPTDVTDVSDVSVSGPPQVRAASPAFSDRSSVRSASPALSVASKASSSSSGKNGPPARRSEPVARKDFIVNHFTITADEAPCKEEFLRVIKEQRHNYPELSRLTWKKFRESCREIVQKKKGVRFADGLGRRKLKDIPKEMKALLQAEGLYNVRIHGHAVDHYMKQLVRHNHTAQIESPQRN